MICNCLREKKLGCDLCDGTGMLKSGSVIMARHMRLGDVVRVQTTVDEGYLTSTVKSIMPGKNGTVLMFRPFTHTASFMSAGRKKNSKAVICYVGIEELEIPLDSDRIYHILARKNL